MTLIPFNISTDSGYVANAVGFPGTAYMTRGGDLTGNVDGKKGLGSLWFRLNGSDSTRIVFFSNDQDRFLVERTAGNLLRIAGQVPGGGTTLDIRSSASYTASSQWHNLMWAYDLSLGTPVAYLYVDNVSLLTTVTLANNNIDYTQGEYAFGTDANTPGTRNIIADVADPYINLVQTLALSSSTNRGKFIDQTTLKPVDLGANGQAVTGSSPIVFFNGPAANFNKNLGTGGDFIITGTLTDTTSPSD